MFVPNDDVALLLRALKYAKFGLVFPFVLDTRSWPELTSKVVHLGSFKPHFGTVGLITIVTHTMFANAICCSTLGGLGSIVSELRLSEKSKSGAEKEFLIRDTMLFFQLGAGALGPENSFLVSKVSVDNQLKLSGNTTLNISMK